MKSLIKVFAPASISNLGAGFDVLGVALNAPGDIVTAKRTKAKGLQFSLELADPSAKLPVGGNVAAYVAQLMLDEFNPPFGIDLKLHKQMPIGSGLGSSAASSVAAVVAVNALLPKPLRRSELLPFVLEGERRTSGSGHADNASPCLLGGACLIRSYDPIDVIKLQSSMPIWWVVVHPQLVVMTKEARGILPKNVPLRSAVRQWGNVGGLVAGLLSGDTDLIGRSMDDVIVEPVRAPLVKGFDYVKEAAFQAGASGCTLSGSGPSMLSVAPTKRQAETIGHAMMAAFRDHAGVTSAMYVSRTNTAGAKIISNGKR